MRFAGQSIGTIEVNKDPGTFISKLLRSESGETWWKILRDSSKEISIPKHIDLNVVTLMPEGSSTQGNLDSIDIEECDTTLHLYTLYYSTDNDGNPQKFSGTLLDTMMK